jgi:CRISP-associated protein Cas1
VQEVRTGEFCRVSLMGNVQLSTQAVQALCEAGEAICYFRWASGFTGSPWG